MAKIQGASGVNNWSQDRFHTQMVASGEIADSALHPIRAGPPRPAALSEDE
jgi:hypothetical protein